VGDALVPLMHVRNNTKVFLTAIKMEAFSDMSDCLGDNYSSILVRMWRLQMRDESGLVVLLGHFYETQAATIPVAKVAELIKMNASL
jgi:hypothetical protein